MLSVREKLSKNPAIALRGLGALKGGSVPWGEKYSLSVARFVRACVDSTRRQVSIAKPEVPSVRTRVSITAPEKDRVEGGFPPRVHAGQEAWDLPIPRHDEEHSGLT